MQEDPINGKSAPLSGGMPSERGATSDPEVLARATRPQCAADPKSPRGWLNWTRAGRALAAASRATGDAEGEREAWREAWEAARRWIELEPGVAKPRAEWSELSQSYAECLRRQGRTDDARKVAELAVP